MADLCHELSPEQKAALILRYPGAATLQIQTGHDEANKVLSAVHDFSRAVRQDRILADIYGRIMRREK